MGKGKPCPFVLLSEPMNISTKTRTAIDLTGYTVYAQAWDKARTKKYADFTVAYTNRTDGKVTISLTDTQTADFIDELYYDVLLEDGSGLREYYLEGVIFVSQGYTAP